MAGPSFLFEKAIRKPPGADDKDGHNVTLPDILPSIQWLQAESNFNYRGKLVAEHPITK